MKEEILLFMVMLVTIGAMAFFTGFFAGSIDSESALRFLSAISKISATLLGMFIAGFLFLLGRLPPRVTTKIVSKYDFVASFLLFTIAVLHSLTSMLTIKQNTSVDFLSPVGFLLYFGPLCWMIGGIVLVALFTWKLYINRSEIPEK